MGEVVLTDRGQNGLFSYTNTPGHKLFINATLRTYGRIKQAVERECKALYKVIWYVACGKIVLLVGIVKKCKPGNRSVQ